MQIFLDSVNLDGIKKYSSLVKGITTNPLVLAQAFPSKDVFLTMFGAMQKDFPNLLINIQVTSHTADEMVQEAKRIVQMGKNIIVKIPLTFEGLKAIKQLKNSEIKINGTLCFSLLQAQMAQDLGIEYVSPFLGRMEESGIDIEEFCYDLRLSMHETKILGASIRSLEHVDLVAKSQFDAITFKESFFEKLFAMELLTNGEKIFDTAVNMRF